jgi:electron transfer flavoprotein alpha/beta subunit
VNYKMNPFDEIAVEEALRLKEMHGGEVVAVTIARTRRSPSSAARSRWGRTALST